MFKLITITFAFLIGFAGCSDSKPASVAELAASDSRLTTLVSALSKAGLVETLQRQGPFTVFAPTNQAFTDAGFDLDSATTEELTPILLYHVVAGAQFAADLESGNVETLSEDSVAVNVSDAGVTLNGDATVIDADLDSGNGVVHIIDKVLIP